MSKKHHGPPHEEHADETWLVPYADLLTLLLALFIVLFATAKVDQEKFVQVATAMNNALGGGLGAALGGSMGANSATSSGAGILTGGAGVAAGPGSTPTSVMSPAELESSQLEHAKSEIDLFIQQSTIDDFDIETVLTDQGLLIRVRDSALFASGSANLFPSGVKFADMVAQLIGDIPQNVLISGHTDNDPINTVQFPSNWELSAARAISLTRYLLDRSPAIDPARVSAIGCGEFRPVASNATAEGRSRNRRVEILIQRKYVDGQTAPDSLVNPTSLPAGSISREN